MQKPEEDEDEAADNNRDFFLSNQHSVCICNNLDMIGSPTDDGIQVDGKVKISGMLTFETIEGKLINLPCKYDHRSQNILSESQLQLFYRASTKYEIGESGESLIMTNKDFTIKFYQHSPEGYILPTKKYQSTNEEGVVFTSVLLTGEPRNKSVAPVPEDGFDYLKGFPLLRG
jgi:hypothetical protein